MKPTSLIIPSLILLLTGCETMQTPQQRREAQARQQAAARQAEERTYRMQGVVESVEMENARLLQEVQSLRGQVSGLNTQIGQLNAKMNALDARQKKEMANLIKEVEALLRKTVSSRSSSGGSSSVNHGAGREHVVESGHTLSAIAQAYGTTVKAIKQANNLKSDQIYIGQKLFIPE
ncbi:LysM peptidoglycan-binding domain-containing protein [Pontiella sp.]|uniref:LysM peptidoglycan-binding domain-containing protein n=1 Tax=Pontiella sp. TaxID=2837462 RepID=UPI003561306F